MATTSREDCQADSIEVFEKAWQAAQAARLCTEKNCTRLEAPLGEAHRAKMEAQAHLNVVRAQEKGRLLSQVRGSEETQAAVAALGLAMAKVAEAEDYMSCALAMLEEAKRGEIEACNQNQAAFDIWRLEEQQQVCSKLEREQSQETRAKTKAVANSLGWSG